jgi:hypothetical protein
VDCPVFGHPDPTAARIAPPVPRLSFFCSGGSAPRWRAVPLAPGWVGKACTGGPRTGITSPLLFSITTCLRWKRSQPPLDEGIEPVVTGYASELLCAAFCGGLCVCPREGKPSSRVSEQRKNR